MDEQYTYRFPPCPAYDVEGMESWLESMAQKGLFLDNDPFFAGFATFRKGEPKAVRYRLQPIPKKRGEPDPAAVELAEDSGWTYLGTHSEFSIFSSDDPNARELNTDSQVHALSINTLHKRRRSNFIWTMAEVLFLLCLTMRMGPISCLLSGSSWYVGILLGVWIVYLVLSVRELRQVSQLKKRLENGETLSRSKDWKHRRWLHWISAALSIGMVIAFFIGWLHVSLFNWEDQRWQIRTEDLPFAHAGDLGAFTAEENWIIQENDHVARRSSLLAAEQIKLSQYGKVDNTELSLEADYYDLRTPWLAWQLYRELLWQAKQNKHYSPQECLDLPTEQEAFYYNFGKFLLLQDGTQVLLVRIVDYDNDLSEEFWTQIFAESLLH